MYIYTSWGPQVGMDQPLDLETALVIVSHSHVDLDQKNQMGGEPNPQGISRLDEVFWFVFIHFNLICWGWFF